MKLAKQVGPVIRVNTSTPTPEGPDITPSVCFTRSHCTGNIINPPPGDPHNCKRRTGKSWANLPNGPCTIPRL
jgi:hypothetical protein